MQGRRDRTKCLPERARARTLAQQTRSRAAGIQFEIRDTKQTLPKVVMLGGQSPRTQPPGQRQGSQNSPCLALGFDRAVPSGRDSAPSAQRRA